MKDDFFPFGTHYYCAPTPLAEDWEYDFEEISKANYTHIQFRVLWRWNERIRGEFTWADLDKLFELAEKYNLRVVLKPMLENAPDWVFNELNGGRIGFNKVPLTHFAMNSSFYAGGFMPCFDNLDVVNASKLFLEELIKRYYNHPSLWCYDAWNEPRSRPLGECCCEHSVISYRSWLERRFGTIEELNSKFYKSWTSYENIIPPASNKDLLEMFLWRQWAEYSVASRVNFVTKSIRSIDKNAYVIVHSGGCDVARDPVCDVSNDMLNAENVDSYGFSLNTYPNPETPLEYDDIEFQSSWIRRIDENFWCHEFYPHGSKWTREIEPNILKMQIWMTVASGCLGFTYWEYRAVRMGVMSSGFGIRNNDGSKKQTSRICENINKTINKFGKSLIETKRGKGKVALLHCGKSDMLQRLQSIDAWVSCELNSEMPNVNYPYKKAIRAAHVAYTINGESVDWVVSGDNISSYPLLHITCTEVINKETAKWLKNYVENGGTLVVEFPFAARDDKTWLTMQQPNNSLDSLLGCKQKYRVTIEEGKTETAKFLNSIKINATTWRIELELTTGEALAFWKNKEIAGVKNSYGKGFVYTLACNAAMSFTDKWDDNIFELYKWILKDAKLYTKQEHAPSKLWIKKRISKDKEIIFAFNISKQTQSMIIKKKPLNIWEMVNTKQVTNKEFLIKPQGILVLELNLNKKGK